MSEYVLYFTQVASTVVTVEADDLESAIQAAYDSDQMPSGICASCSGWGQSWNMDMSGEWELDEKSAQADYPE